MSNQLSRRDPWRWPIIFLWAVFFLLGLWPELSFYGLRSAGYVFSQNAIINSYHFITWCLAGYIMHFTYHRCVEAGVPPIESLGKSIQLGVVAFVAFIDMPVDQFMDIRNPADRALVLGMGLVKLAAWIYLFSLLVRYIRGLSNMVIARSLSWMALTTAGPEEKGSAPAESGQHAPSAPPAPMKEQAD